MANRWSRDLLAEAIGTFLLTFVGAAVICTDAYAAGSIGIVGIALAHGLVLVGIVAAFGHVSGAHVNPAVTLAATIVGELAPMRAAGYFVSQLVGAGAAGGLLLVIFGTDLWDPVSLGAPVLGVGVTPGTATLVETVLTFMFVLVVLFTAVDPRVPDSVYALPIGATFAAGVLIGAPVTGAALNPARAFGPAFAAGAWDFHYVHWVGPLGGGALAALVFAMLRHDGEITEEELARMLEEHDEAAGGDDGGLRLVDDE